MALSPQDECQDQGQPPAPSRHGLGPQWGLRRALGAALQRLHPAPTALPRFLCRLLGSLPRRIPSRPGTRVCLAGLPPASRGLVLIVGNARVLPSFSRNPRAVSASPEARRCPRAAEVRQVWQTRGQSHNTNPTRSCSCTASEGQGNYCLQAELPQLCEPGRVPAVRSEPCHGSMGNPRQPHRFACKRGTSSEDLCFPRAQPQLPTGSAARQERRELCCKPQPGLSGGKTDTGTEPVRSVLRWAAAQRPGGDFQGQSRRPSQPGAETPRAAGGSLGESFPSAAVACSPCTAALALCGGCPSIRH